jgi:hypothetical protein
MSQHMLIRSPTRERTGSVQHRHQSSPLRYSVNQSSRIVEQPSPSRVSRSRQDQSSFIIENTGMTLGDQDYIFDDAFDRLTPTELDYNMGPQKLKGIVHEHESSIHSTAKSPRRCHSATKPAATGNESPPFGLRCNHDSSP